MGVLRATKNPAHEPSTPTSIPHHAHKCKKRSRRTQVEPRGGVERVYVIARGDTLSGIAARHNVSVETLLRHNSLSSTNIRVGQRIRIPAI